MACSQEFREGLRRELDAWQSDGIVTPGAARALSSRYDLETAAGTAGARGDHSAAIAATSAAVLACALVLALATTSTRAGALLPIAALAAALASAPLVLRGEAFAPTANALRCVGRAVFYVSAFALSFVPVAGALLLRSPTSPGLLAAAPPFLLALAALVAGLRRTDVDAHARGEAMLLTATVLAFAAGLFLDTGSGAAVVANLALAFLAAGRIVRGVSWLARGAFWEGLVVAAIVAMSRMVEVTLPGWPRFTGAFLVAAGAVAAGTVFERRRARAPDEAHAHAP
ncbi:MAG TPA: hypothetical protein VFK90_16655 [Anaeromyxobacter sp.]|nr:hypothetical protein [Anaeromyxobacter sp.]